MKEKGFSLFEILVVTTVFAIVIIVINQAFFTTLRGTTKSAISTKVKQSADYAIAVIERNLYSARNLSFDIETQTVSYLTPTGSTDSFSCIELAPHNYNLMLNSESLTPSDVQIITCSITFNTDNSVSVNLEVSQVVAANQRPEEMVVIPVQTRVVVRNE